MSKQAQKSAGKSAYRVLVSAGIAMLVASGAYAQQRDSGWYGGINLGRSDIRSFDSGINNVFSSQGISGSTSVDRDDTTYSLNLGYQFTRNFALEGSYVDLGKFDFRSAIASPAVDTAHGQYKADGWTVSGVGIVPLDNGVALYGKAGLLFADAKLDAGSDTGAVPISGASRSTTGQTYGLGMSYDFGNNLLGKVEWNRYQNVGDPGTTGKFDFNTYTVGIGYRF